MISGKDVMILTEKDVDLVYAVFQYAIKDKFEMKSNVLDPHEVCDMATQLRKAKSRYSYD